MTNNEGQPKDAITQQKICISSVGMLKTHSAGRSSLKSQLSNLIHKDKDMYCASATKKNLINQVTGASFQRWAEV